MIAWTTPTLPVRLNTGLLESTKCEVYGTFSQNGRALTIKPFYIHSDPETDRTYLKFNLSQLQSGGFKPGAVSFQVNFIDWMAYRTAQLEIAEKYGIPYIDLNGDSGTPAMLRAQNDDISAAVKTIRLQTQSVDYDGTITGTTDWHPNYKAHEFESTFIESFLRSI